MIGIAISILICSAISVALAIPWVRAIDKSKDDPKYQNHKNDPDYWEWP